MLSPKSPRRSPPSAANMMFSGLMSLQWKDAGWGWGMVGGVPEGDVRVPETKGRLRGCTLLPMEVGAALDASTQVVNLDRRCFPGAPVHNVVGVQEGEGEQQRHDHVAAHVRLRHQPAGAHQPPIQVAACSTRDSQGQQGPRLSANDAKSTGGGASRRASLRARLPAAVLSPHAVLSLPPVQLSCTR